MCGIAGTLNPSSVRTDRELLERMSSLLKHRGPSDRGIETPHPQVGFAFRRLAILDLSEQGHQPMFSADLSACLVFNGEIYNFEELKKQYAPDYPYRSSSDSEVILALYQKLGLGMVPLLNGMFAMAIWDDRARRLHLVADRFGIKPLYYTFTSDGSLLFASEIKALLADPRVRRRINPEAVNDYLSFQFVYGEDTFFDGIFNLEPGTILTFDLKSPMHPETRHRYWDLKFESEPSSCSAVEMASELRGAIENAVRRQTRSDVPVGTFLSGGMDTGVLATLAARTIPSLDTFTCGFNVAEIETRERLNDERTEARELAKLIRSRHHEILIESQDIRSLLSPTFYHMEDPRVGISYQIYAMAEEVKKSATVVLSGTGGDELFAGYGWRYDQILGLQDFGQFKNAYFNVWNRILSVDEKRKFMPADRLRQIDLEGPRARFEKSLEPARDFDPLSRALYFDSKNFLRGLLLVDDKLNMAHSVESRVPLLDNEVVEVATRIPSRFKYDGSTTKVILKDAVRGIVPDDVLNRRKQGFTPPDDHWFRNQNRDWLRTRLTSEEFLDQRWVTREGVEHILVRLDDGDRSSRFLIWSLLGLDQIYSQFIKSPTAGEGAKHG